VTTTTAATAVTAAATTTTAAAAAWPLFARFGDIDREGPAAEFLAIHGVNGLLSFFRGAHGDEGEAPGPTGRPVHHQVGLDDGTVCPKSVLQIIFRDVKGQISNKQFCAHVMCPMGLD
jgi:hypothetical protein